MRGLLLFAALILGGCTQKTVPGPIRLGHVAPLSGPAQSRGDHARWGLQLAVTAALADDHKVLDRRLVVHHADDQGDAAVLQAEAIRLLAVTRVAALIGTCDAELGEALARAALPYSAPILLTGELTVPPRDGVWTLGAGPDARGRALAHYARTSLKAKRAALLVAGRAALPAAVVEAFRREWSLEPVAAVERWDWSNEAQLGELASPVAGWRPDVVVLGGGVEDFLKARRRLDEAKVSVPLLFAGEDISPAAFRGGNVPGGLYLATAYASEALTETGQDFSRRYEEAFHEAPDIFAVQAHDAAQLLIDALPEARSTAPAKLREQLAGLQSFESLIGPVTFNSRQARRPVFVVAVQDGRARRVTTMPASE
jgi:branched-chain amino acid transport system substrate-binding protein